VTASLSPVVVVMGVAGCGKSTLAAALAEHLGAAFLDADALHADEAVAKMTAGIPLTDVDRWPWLDRVGAALQHARGTGGEPVVGACSALRRAYRDRLRAQCPGLLFVHLEGSRDSLTQRMRERTGHFMRVDMLDSQLTTLEPLEADEDALVVSIEPATDETVVAVARWLAER
jgi:carbohydrate kinase (thermoresistant glucokinase family)